ncbi:MAG: Cof-type HAD-IIB family hydrolase [Oscillospiraceae bacterium]|jgi:Cof subfamily protein (haloacid dehalogenase superfamily)|nr:Cof-type HAD-IIB family hydrolase [Oscillospiraceae bacterium]
MPAEIRMIVTDLDRTLLRSDNTISEYTADVLRRCQARGIFVVFATARYFRTIEEWVVPAIGFQPDIAISSNGAYAYGEGKVRYQALIEPQLASQIIAEIRARRGQITVGTSRLRLSERPIEASHISFSALCEFQTPITEDVHYIDFRGGDHIAEDIGRLFPQVRLQSYVDSLTTFVHKDAYKGLALSEIIRQLHMNKENVVGFGDDINDLDFLDVCGTKIAVANAVAKVKAAADFVCGSNDGDGPARWLAEHVLRES